MKQQSSMSTPRFFYLLPSPRHPTPRLLLLPACDALRCRCRHPRMASSWPLFAVPISLFLSLSISLSRGTWTRVDLAKPVQVLVRAQRRVRDRQAKEGPARPQHQPVLHLQGGPTGARSFSWLAADPALLGLFVMPAERTWAAVCYATCSTRGGTGVYTFYIPSTDSTAGLDRKEPPCVLAGFVYANSSVRVLRVRHASFLLDYCLIDAT